MSTRRQRRDRDPALDARMLAIGALAILAAVAAIVVSIGAQKGIPGRSYYEVSAQFNDVRILPSPGSDVRVAGRRIGQTRGARLERGLATIELKLDEGAGPLPADTVVRLRAKGLLGAQFVDVVPGHSARKIPAGSVIAPAPGATVTAIGEVLDALDQPRRSALRQTLRGLGGGLADRGDELNEALATVKGFASFRRLVRPLLARAGATSRLVRTAELFAGALDGVREDFAGGFAPTERAVRPFGQERASVARLLAVAPSALARTREGLHATDPLLLRTERFARSAARFTRDAPPALHALTRVLRDGREPLRRARAIVSLAGDAVPPTLRLTAALSPIQPRLRSALALTGATVRELGRYECDIARFATSWRSFLGYGSRTQTGPLGPLTELRVTLAGTGVVPNGPLVQSGVDGDMQPCEPIARKIP